MDFGFGSSFGNPWDIGTGMMAPLSGLNGNMPTMPSTGSLPEMFANGLASQGIRPNQFMANPSVINQAVPTPPLTSENNWDPTPVDMPGGRPVSLPGSPRASTGAIADQPTQEQAGITPQESSPTSGDGKKEKSGFDKFAEGLKGVKAPTPPAVQTIRTPSAPEPKAGAVKSGELMALLAALQPQTATKPLYLNGAIR